MSPSAGRTVTLAGAAILGLYLAPLALASSASLLVVFPRAAGGAIQAAAALLVSSLAGLFQSARFLCAH